MTDQHNTAPAVWDPTARGGAGGWVRGGQAPQAPQPPAAPGTNPAATPDADAEATRKLPPVPPAAPTAPAAPAAPAAAPQPPAGPPSHSPDLPLGEYPPPPESDPDADYTDYTAYENLGDPEGHEQYQAHQSPQAHRDPDDEDAPTNRRAPLLIAFALLLVLALGGGILWAVQGDDAEADRSAAPAPTATAPDNGTPQPAPANSGAVPTGGSTGGPTAATPPTSPSSTPSGGPNTPGPKARTQATALEGLLTRGEAAKSPIGSAVAKVSSCPAKTDIERVAKDFEAGAEARGKLLTELNALDLSEVPGGEEARLSLKSAWQLSADMDRAYAAWARSVAEKGCSDSAPNTEDKQRADGLKSQAARANEKFAMKWKPLADAFGLTPFTSDRI